MTEKSGLDDVLVALDQALKTVRGVAQASRPSPAEGIGEANDLTPPDRRLSGSLMRVNHVGEVCAQALYQAQSLMARNAEIRAHMSDAAREERDHLAWTKARLDALGDRPSLLNPFWYAGSFAMGLVAGALGDRISLGFIVETERQVESHLATHLNRLPTSDRASRSVVERMLADESSHAESARNLGAHELPTATRSLMSLAAGIMTTTAHYL